MADTMQFDLVSPEKSLASLAAREVQIPGAEGDLTAMPNHAPLITTLRPGVLRIIGESETLEFIVTGGFAEIGAQGASVLAEQAVAVSDMTQDVMDEIVASAKDGDESDTTIKRLNDLAMVASGIGLNA